MTTEVIVPLDDSTGNLIIFVSFLIVYGCILLFGVVMCAAFSISLYRGRRVLNQWPFFRIVKHLTIMDGIFMFSQIMNTFPDMVRDSVGCNHSLTPNAWLNSIPVKSSMQLLEFIPNKGLIYISLLITINRMAVFVYPSWRRLFDGRTIFFPIFACWVWVLSVCFLSLLITPTQRFNPDVLRFEDVEAPLLVAPALLHIIQGLDYAVPFIIAGMYVRIYFSIRASRSIVGPESLCNSRSSEDRKMLTQALVISAFLVLYNTTTLAEMFFVPGGWGQRILGMCQLILSVLNHSVHSTLFILTNSTIRNYLLIPKCLRNLTTERRRHNTATPSDTFYI